MSVEEAIAILIEAEDLKNTDELTLEDSLAALDDVTEAIAVLEVSGITFEEDQLLNDEKLANSPESFETPQVEVETTTVEV